MANRRAESTGGAWSDTPLGRVAALHGLDENDSLIDDANHSSAASEPVVSPEVVDGVEVLVDDTVAQVDAVAEVEESNGGDANDDFDVNSPEARLRRLQLELAQLSGEDLAAREASLAKDSAEYSWVKKELWERAKYAFDHSVRLALKDYLPFVPTHAHRATLLRRKDKSVDLKNTALVDFVGRAEKDDAGQWIAARQIPFIAQKDESRRRDYMTGMLRFSRSVFKNGVIYFDFYCYYDGDDYGWSMAEASSSRIRGAFSKGPFSYDLGNYESLRLKVEIANLDPIPGSTGQY